MSIKEKQTILFLCTGNSCRSQMAEAWCRHLHGDLFLAASAGISKQKIDPIAVKVMAEIGIDLTCQFSKTTAELGAAIFDYVITLCANADANCPLFPAKTAVIHHGFDDPPQLAKNAVCETDSVNIYRRVRDEIRDYIAEFPETCLSFSPKGENVMDIKILGTGCAKCEEAERNVREAVAELKLDATIEKIKDFREFTKYGVFTTPAVVIDGETKCVGKTPSKKEVLTWLGK